MLKELPAPETLQCYFDSRFAPHLPAMRLHWDLDPFDFEHESWRLPEGVLLPGLPPENFGISIERRCADGYNVRLLWDRTYLCWSNATRSQLLASDLPRLLNAMGTDLWYLLDQPITSDDGSPRKAA